MYIFIIVYVLSLFMFFFYVCVQYLIFCLAVHSILHKKLWKQFFYTVINLKITAEFWFWHIYICLNKIKTNWKLFGFSKNCYYTDKFPLHCNKKKTILELAPEDTPFWVLQNYIMNCMSNAEFKKSKVDLIIFNALLTCRISGVASVYIPFFCWLSQVDPPF